MPGEQVTRYQDLHQLSTEELRKRLKQLNELEDSTDWRMSPRVPQEEKRLIGMVLDTRERERKQALRQQRNLEKIRGVPETAPVSIAGRLLSFEERTDLAMFLRSMPRRDQVQLAGFVAAVLDEELARAADEHNRLEGVPDAS